MPSKIQLDENLWFLYICLQQSDYKSIDFNAVGEATNLKPPAARMRYTRLRRQIEGGTHGTPFSGSVEKTAGARKKKKVSRQIGDDVECAERSIRIENTSEDQKMIKVERAESFDEFEGSSMDDSDSEDEIPLAKRRAIPSTCANPPQTPQPSLQFSLEQQRSPNPTPDNQWTKSLICQTDAGNQCQTHPHFILKPSTSSENINCSVPAIVARGPQQNFHTISPLFAFHPTPNPQQNQSNVKLSGFWGMETSDQLRQSKATVGPKNVFSGTPLFEDFQALKTEGHR